MPAESIINNQPSTQATMQSKNERNQNKVKLLWPTEKKPVIYQAPAQRSDERALASVIWPRRVSSQKEKKEEAEAGTHLSKGS
jgi:hypothetical protein